MATSERVQQMMQHFMEHRQAGLSTAEIAKIYHISQRSIYSRLQEIADREGVRRDSLLYQIHPPKEPSEKAKDQQTKAQIEEIKEKFQTVSDEITGLRQKIGELLADDNGR